VNVTLWIGKQLEIFRETEIKNSKFIQHFVNGFLASGCNLIS
jgi:hypothetical protein